MLYNDFFRNLVLSNSCKTKYWDKYKLFHNNSLKYNNSSPKPSFKKPKWTKITLAITTGGILQIVLINNKALCEIKKTRMTTYKKSENNLKFDWKLFWEYLKPHIWYFIAAVAVNFLIKDKLCSILFCKF